MLEKKILAVDDDSEIRLLFSRFFPSDKYSVTCAASAEEALEILEKEKFYVIFLDISLPGMNGIDLCRKIRQDVPYAIIHAVTGYASIFQLADCRRAGFDDYYVKPFSRDALVNAAEAAFTRLARWRGENT